MTGNECCERLAYYGMSTNLVNYLGQRFNQGNAAAAKTVTTWSGTCYITPLLGAFLADSYLGRYWTIASFSVIYVIVSLRPQKILFNGPNQHVQFHYILITILVTNVDFLCREWYF